MKPTCVITGATSGIGWSIAELLLHKSWRVILVGRTLERARQAADRLEKGSPGASIVAVGADLGSQVETERLADRIAEGRGPIELLIHSAGVFYSRRRLSPEGHEITLAVNHLAAFLLTHRLLGRLRRSNQARVLVVGSETHRHAKIHFDDLSLEDNYHGIRAYAQSKLANVLFVKEFARRCPFSSVAAGCLEPGLVRTDIGFKHAGWLHASLWRLQSSRMVAQMPGEAAKPIVEIATREKALPSGVYWSRGHPCDPAPLARGEEVASRLWEMSLRQTGIKDYFGGGQRIED